MILLTADKLKNAVIRARAEARNYVVRRTNAVRMYRVENKVNGNIYTVNLYKGVDGNKYGSCDCKAGQAGKHGCKHLVQAVSYNAYLAANGQLEKVAVSVR